MIPIIPGGAFIGTISARLKSPAAHSAERHAQVDSRYEAAIRGDTGALELLRTQNYAKAEATEYSRQRYQEAIAYLAAHGVETGSALPATSVQAGSGGGLGGIVRSVQNFINGLTAGPSQQIGQAAGASAAQQIKGPLVLIGVVLAGALVISAVVLSRRR